MLLDHSDARERALVRGPRIRHARDIQTHPYVAEHVGDVARAEDLSGLAHRSDPSSRQSGTEPNPFRSRSPMDVTVKPSSRNARAIRSSMTIWSGVATPTTRLARLTVGPKQSACRV